MHNLTEQVADAIKRVAPVDEPLIISNEFATTTAQLAGMIDHTLLSPTATSFDIETLCREAEQHKFAAVCINPGRVELAVDCLSNTPVAVASVVGFPLGATTTEAKLAETKEYLRLGADELDMVINQGELKAGDYQGIMDEIQAIKNLCGDKILKVIIETANLTRSEKIAACVISKEAGADLVKTSTGFAASGATVADVALMRAVVGDTMGIKAAGGIKNHRTAMAMVAAGATRIGTSNGLQIIDPN